MVKGAGAPQTPPQTDSNGQNKPVFWIGVPAPDCGAKLHFCAAKSLKRNQEFWRCSNYKSGRGTCQIHYIRDVVLERIVFEAISGLADFVKCHETVFLYMLAKKTNAMRQKEHKKLQQTVEQGTRRIAEIDRLIEKVFEQNASGILSDERFSKMLQSYEKDDAGGFRQSKDLAGSEAEGYGFKAAAPYPA